MAVLQIRDLPDHLYDKLKSAAEREHRSLSQQAIALLERALASTASPKARRQELVREVLARELPETSQLDPVLLIRDERDR
jgi:plasmid stability protein